MHSRSTQTSLSEMTMMSCRALRQILARFAALRLGPASVPSTTSREEDVADQQVVLPNRDGTSRYLLGPTAVLGGAVSTARATFDGVSQWAVNLEMTSDGIEGFNQLATDCFNRTPTCPTGLLAITLEIGRAHV